MTPFEGQTNQKAEKEKAPPEKPKKSIKEMVLTPNSAVAEEK